MEGEKAPVLLLLPRAVQKTQHAARTHCRNETSPHSTRLHPSLPPNSTPSRGRACSRTRAGGGGEQRKRPLPAGAGSMAGALLVLLILLCPFAEEMAAAAAAGKQSVVHDDLNSGQVNNPITTVPSTNPTPTIITVPSTNPTITIPSLNPLPTPITEPPPSTAPPVPVIYPLPTPSNAFPPTVPVTNPTVTTPSTFPPSAPFTNPPASNPTPTPPPAQIITAPAAPSQQVWCVVKATGSSEAALQNALDYTCGIGGADCSAIQPSGSCYYPNTLQAHASYAFNTYYQRNPAPSSCDFGGTAMLVTANPSSGNCVFASSSSSTVGYNPASTATPLSSSSGSGSGSGSPVLNASGAGFSEPSEFSPDIPGAVDMGDAWRSINPPHWSWAALLWILHFVHV